MSNDILTSNPGPADRWHAVRRSGLATAPATTDWLWTGYLAAGNMTLLTSPWKAGKTTLTTLLLARLQSGGELAGQAVRAGAAVVVSEESAAQWRRRADRLDLGEHVFWLCRPFAARPSLADWQALLDHIAALHRQHGLSLLVIDPWAAFLPIRSENVAGPTLDVLLALQQVAKTGVAVLLLHHPRKSASADGQWARGSGALAGFVDVVMEMRYFRSASDADRRRVLQGYSRFEETPRRRVIELNEAGTAYASLGDLDDEAFGRGWREVLAILAVAPKKLTRPEIVAAWPATEKPPCDSLLYGWLERAIRAGQVQRDGRGRKRDPYRYWLPERVAEWEKQDFLGPAKRQQDEDLIRELVPDED
jgi:hypothetical protein